MIKCSCCLLTTQQRLFTAVCQLLCVALRGSLQAASSACVFIFTCVCGCLLVFKAQRCCGSSSMQQLLKQQQQQAAAGAATLPTPSDSQSSVGSSMCSTTSTCLQAIQVRTRMQMCLHRCHVHWQASLAQHHCIAAQDCTTHTPHMFRTQLGVH